MTKEQLIKQIFSKKSFLCVGLDSDMNKLPKFLLDTEEPVFNFNKEIIDATAEYCVAYKPNLAFYECRGVQGLMDFEKTVRYIRDNYPDHFIIADAKRGDIGNTAEMYAKTFFDTYNVDAVTVAPYMGEDSVTPFLKYKEKWVIVLALTSNKGSQDFQTMKDVNGLQLFEKVIDRTNEWGGDEQVMYVVGATRGEAFADIRKHAPNNFLLVPGVGAQGGSLEQVCKYGMTKDCGLIVNSSRGIIFASDGKDFAEQAALKAKDLQQQMAKELEKL